MVEEKLSQRWIVVIGGFLILMCLGVAYTWGVFIMPIAKEFGWGRGETSLAVSILLLVFSVFMVAGGIAEKKYGPKVIASAGGILVSLGWILACFTKSLWWLYFSYGVLSGIGTGLGYSSSISTAIKWFPDKKGLVIGIVVFGFGFGAAFIAPLAARFIELYGWRTTMLIYGICSGMIIIGAAQLLKAPPANWNPAAGVAQKGAGLKADSYDFSPRQMLKTATFRLIFITYFIAMLAGMMVIGHISAFAIDAGYTANQAAFMLTVLAIANGLGRIFFGVLFDKIGRKNAIGALLLFMAAGMLILSSTLTLFAFYAAAGFIGLCFGGFLAVYPAATGDFFGARDFGINYGLVFMGYGAGCFMGPWFAGVVYDITGSYAFAFMLAGILAAAGSIITFLFLKPPRLCKAKIC